MVKKWIAKYLFVVQLTMLLIAILSIVMSSITTLSSKLGVTFFSFGVAILSSTIISILHSALGTDIPTLVEHRIEFQDNVYKLGLEMIYLRVGDESIFKRFSEAHSIDLMYNTAKNTTLKYGQKITEAIIKHGATVRILISNPDNTIWSNKTICEALCPWTDIVHEINEVLSYMNNKVVNELNLHKPPLTAGSLEVRFYSNMPTCSILILDDEIARFTPYLPYAHSVDVPIFDIVKGRGGELYAQYRNIFDRVWDNSQTVFKVDWAAAKSRKYQSGLLKSSG